jgi:hypothetical protein
MAGIEAMVTMQNLPSDFDLIQDALRRLDPDTREHVIAAMKIVRTMPRPVAVRFLTEQAWRAQLLQLPPFVQLSGC